MVQPLLSPDGQFLYVARGPFQSNLGRDDVPDIWISRQQSGRWMPLVHLNYPLNDFAANYPVGVGLNREWLAVLRRTSDTLQLQGFRQQGRRWEKQWSALPPLTDSMRYWFDWHLSHDQQQLFFCAAPDADAPADIFVARRLDKEQWSFPERLPEPANSPYHEASVFLAADGRGLYFSSDRPGGYGQQDLWYSQAWNVTYSRWTVPQNLGAPINSAGHDMDITISAVGKTGIFVRSQGDTTGLYQCILPRFARPESVSLVSIQLTGESTIDSLNLVIFPAEQPPLQQIIAKSSRSEEQIVLSSGQTYAAYAQTGTPLFSPSLLINLGGPPAEQLDYSIYSDTSKLQKSRVYQERAGIIRNLQQQLLTLEQDIAQLITSREEDINRLYQFRFPDLPTGMLSRNDPEMRSIEERYEAARRREMERRRPQFSQSEYDLFVTPPLRDTLTAQTAQERLDQLRQRFRLRQEEGYVPDDPLSTTTLDSLERQAQQPPDFLSFRSDLVQRLQARLFTEVREDVVRRAIPVAIQRLRNTLDDNEQFILVRDEEQLPDLLGELEVPVQPTDTSMLRPLESWQRPFVAMLRDRLRAAIRPLMRSAMSEDVRRYFLRTLTYYIKRERQIILEESLEQQIEEQTLEESRLGVWDTRLSSPSAPDTQVVVRPEVRIQLPVAPARSHQPVTLEAMLFRANQATFLAAAIPDLQRIIDFLQQHPNRNVHLDVHTHQNLTHTYALELTRQRARQIRRYLEQGGISAERIRVRPRGCSRPQTWSKSPAALARNQRVEIYFFTEGGRREGEGEKG